MVVELVLVGWGRGCGDAEETEEACGMRMAKSNGSVGWGTSIFDHKHGVLEFFEA